MAITIARIRLPMLWAAGVLILATIVTSPLGVAPPGLAIVAVIVLGAALIMYLLSGKVTDAPREVHPPVSDRWVGVNSPASRVPSHGMHAYGQSYAIDLAHEPTPKSRPPMGWRPVMRRPEEFPAFDQPVLAPADGTLTRARHRSRDHRSRNSWPGLVYMFAEGSLRELGGVSRIFGNHLILRLDTGEYVAIAHLRRDSILPNTGDRVRAGQQIARCGNSGNSSEPHVHFQLMDHPNPLFAAGLPFNFASVQAESDAPSGVPANGTAILADPPHTEQATSTDP